MFIYAKRISITIKRIHIDIETATEKRNFIVLIIKDTCVHLFEKRLQRRHNYEIFLVEAEYFLTDIKTSLKK